MGLPVITSRCEPWSRLVIVHRENSGDLRSRLP